MEDVVPDILEDILLRLDVKDLIRCKSVCKLWSSFISGDDFVKAQLKRSYNNDHDNNNFRARRIVMSGFDSNTHKCVTMIVGSSNGLVCIASSRGLILVANPSTRQFRILPNPPPDYMSGGGFFLRPVGFGYDSFSDDYKVVLGSGGRFSVFSLKTNAWKYAGWLGYNKLLFKFVGTLCNGVIHWLVCYDSFKYVIIAFDLSTEEFKKIPQPEITFSTSRLGIIDGCLCVYDQTVFYSRPGWVMKSYNVKSSWTLLLPYKVNDAIHTLKSLQDDCIPHSSFFTDDNEQIELAQELCAPIYVRSLVSPHAYRSLKRKREPTNNHKLTKGDMRSI